ncbi:hypothetical protein [Clostridium sp. FP1]|uniref:hypothetical protein n=1 Tax=Clostridium sp. FP1 TaxID=2724076 RepID=UPI0013E923EE|nr:hypothetical protein [Clostridium sp. FP1]MBZ9635339.1 hypothetical protein [Clostridium sp. FP1]
MIINNEEISLLKAKIIDYEREIIRNHKTFQDNQSEIELLRIKNFEKNKVINSFENKIDELNIINKNYEDQISSQSKNIITYLEKIEKLQNSVRALDTSLKNATRTAVPLLLKPDF